MVKHNRIALLADIHGNIKNLKKILGLLEKTDIIVIAGDIAGTVSTKLILRTILKSRKISRERYVDYVYSSGKEAFCRFQRETVKKIFKLLERLKKPIFFTHGNSELPEIYEEYKIIASENDNFYYLGNSVINFEELIISGYGFCQPSNYRRPFKTPGEKTFEEISKDLTRIEQCITDYRSKNAQSVVIGVFHEPPFNTCCDFIPHKNIHAGNKLVSKHVSNTKYDYLITGHIHEAQCSTRVDNTLIVNPGPLVENKFALLELNDKKVTFRSLSTRFSKETIIYSIRKLFP